MKERKGNWKQWKTMIKKLILKSVEGRIGEKRGLGRSGPVWGEGTVSGEDGGYVGSFKGKGGSSKLFITEWARAVTLVGKKGRGLHHHKEQGGKGWGNHTLQNDETNELNEF